MQHANYTSDNICRALGLGLGEYAGEGTLENVSRSIRLLLKPSFHPELCISFYQTDNAVTVSVVAARSQIWQQMWPAPKPAPIDSALGSFSAVGFDGLVLLLEAAGQPGSSPRFLVLDGLGAHTILRSHGQQRVNIDENASYEKNYKTFVAQAISETWDVLDNPSVRNALRSAGGYVGLDFPELNVPAPKPVVRTVVLGPEGDAAHVMQALKKHHEG